MDVRIKEEPSPGVRDWNCAPSKHATSNKAAAEAVPPLECAFEGHIGGFLSETSRLCLRISSDGELRGEVWRKRPTAATVNAAGSIGAVASTGSDGAKRRRVEAPVAVKSEGHAPPTTTKAAVATGVWPGNDHILIAHVAGSAVYVKVDSTESIGGDQGALSGDGALKRDPGALVSAENRTDTFEYYCTFDVTKRTDHIDRHTVRCRMHIPAAPRALGKLYAADVADGQWSLPFQRQSRASAGASSKDKATSGSDGGTTSSPSLKEQPKPEEKLFRLTRIDPNAEGSIADADMAAGRRSRLYPLRPGKYDFQGFTTYETPVASPTPRRRGRRRRSSTPPAITKDECIVSLRLFPDGKLRGTSRELVHPQVCAVYGNWQVNRVIYILEYRVRDAVGHFRYSGGVDTSAEGDKLVGKWRNVDEGHADGYEGGKGEFELGLVHVRYDTDVDGKLKREKKQDPATKFEPPSIDQAVTTDATSPVVKPEEQEGIEAKADIIVDDDEEDLTITALTSGHYKLKGEATDSDGYEYAFELIMTLYPGGQLVGASSERIFEQTRPVTGRWNRLSIAYDQAYVVRREVGIYLYAGELSPDGVVIRGQWRNAEDKNTSIRSEHGTFALAITSAERFWSTDSHRDFPRGFQDAVHCLLLCSARSHALPGALWIHILAFCDEKWFVPRDDEDVKSVDDGLECKPEVLV